MQDLEVKDWLFNQSRLKDLEFESCGGAMMNLFLSLIFITLFVELNSFAEVPHYLQHWRENPMEATHQIPPKTRSQTLTNFNKFSSNDVAIPFKDKARIKLCRQNGFENCKAKSLPFALGGEDYALSRFVGAPLEKNIFKLDLFKSGAAQKTPWSGFYWPQFVGGIGYRYSDSNFPFSYTFMDNFKYYEKNYHKDVKKVADLNQLSPSEKYDLLFNDRDWSLTYYSWAVPRRTWQMSGNVETWTGICHGWAAAAVMVPEPRRSVDFYIDSARRHLTLYPDDIKALTSQLWASSRLNATFLGGRCDVKNPETDANGRIIDPNCFDTNPGNWHLALLNLMGINKKSFVFDATYDYQVWNQPVASYKLSYFNPMTLDEKSDLKDAMITSYGFAQDRFKAYRSPSTKYIAGVKMQLTYVTETRPEAMVGITNSEASVVEVTYYYDLELDADYNVIGGEWYQAAHPDMMWRPFTEKPLAENEPNNSQWNGQLPMPLDLQQLMKPAAKLNQPISAVIQTLLQMSQY